jgi:hypothetical protein
MKTIGLVVVVMSAGLAIGFYIGVAVLMMWPAIRTSLGW